jgi:hypothetical protein
MVLESHQYLSLPSKNHIILITICPSFNQDGEVGTQLPTSFLMLLVDIIDVILLNEIIFYHGLPHIDPCPHGEFFKFKF